RPDRRAAVPLPRPGDAVLRPDGDADDGGAAPADDPGAGRIRRVNVLFVCVQNAGRSQIAEALLARAASGRHSARSAGSAPAEHVHPEVIEALAEVGSDVARRVPRALERADAEWADVVVTMGCG